MRVSRVDTYTFTAPSPDDIRATLQKIADIHNVSVDELLKSASAVGADGPGYLVRAGNLKRRLERIEANE